ncbi:cysteine desulfurase [Meridianimaribacter sp. CL38]|uniref:cysteine desulfurase family protein n=1 Tax=Meridianimaribacter sp. CL38 TaxID=2213021 RepID=UPI0010403F6B|nr:cysteine desulfurase family protein [Meridianimaribacter sp. CL38]TBV25881.1 cysteine desulfurase [Meridianimaribacter sp. CL38]
MKKVYFDNAATTPMRAEVVNKMTEVMMSNFGNASSTHSFGRSSKALIENSRKSIAKHFNALASEIVFTAGGTEADNLILRSAVRDLGVTDIITSKIEHHAVLHTLEALSNEYNVSLHFVSLLDDGNIDIEHLETVLTSTEKALVSLMHVNNEIGNILDIKRVAQLCKANGALFHSDTVQSVGHYKIDLQDVAVDFITASAHKFHGPKGVGFAFIRKNSGLKASVFGGEQERGFRAGTEAIHDIVGMEEALNISYNTLEEETAYISDLKHYFITKLQDVLPQASFNGASKCFESSTYTLVNVCLPIAPEKAPMLHFQLDLKGIACSKGSACQSGSTLGSHVLSQILDEEQLKKPSVRFSFSSFNTKDEVDYVIEVLKDFVEN